MDSTCPPENTKTSAAPKAVNPHVKAVPIHVCKIGCKLGIMDV